MVLLLVEVFKEMLKMVMVNFSFKMAVILKDISKMILHVDLIANKKHKIIYLKDHVNKMIFMELEELFIIMNLDNLQRCMLDNFTKELNMDMENIHGLMELVIKGNGIMGKLLTKEFISKEVEDKDVYIEYLLFIIVLHLNS